MATTTVERADPDSAESAVPPERRARPRPGRLSRSRHRAMRALRRTTGRKLAFRLVMLLFIGLIAASYAVPLWFQLQGDKLLIVTSGSMEPQIPTGSAVVVHPISSPAELRVGQVVSFWPLDKPEMLTHRIIALKHVERRDKDNATIRDASGRPITDPYIQTAGDNNRPDEFGNPQPDPNLTPVGQVRGIVRDVHAGWGYLLAFAHSGQGRFLLFVPPLLLLLGAELMSRVPERWSAANWNKTLIAIRNRDSARGGPLARSESKTDHELDE